MDLDRGKTVAVPLLSKNDFQNNFLPWVLTISVGFGTLLFGYHAGFSSPTDSAILQEVFAGNRERADLAWSILNIGAMFGALLAGSLASSFGRKPAVLINCVPYVLGALMMLVSTHSSSSLFVAGRFVTGAGVGYSSVVVPLYIAEIAPPSLRGTLGCINQLNISTGVLIVTVIGLPIIQYESWWRIMVWVSLGFAAAQFIPILFFAPESPIWLCSHGFMDDARKSLQLLRGKRCSVDSELQSLTSHTQQNADDGEAPSILSVMTSRRLRRPVLIGIGLMMLQQFSGINGVVFNMKSIFVGGENNVDASYVAMMGSICVNGFQVIATGIACSVIEKIGRRQLLLTSCTGMALSCMLMAVAAFLSMPAYVKIVALCGYICMFAIGVGPLPWLLCSEIFPSEIRSFAMSVATVINWACSFLVTLAFDSMMKSLGAHGLFLSYAFVCAMGTMFVFVTVPETQGLSLEEIEDMWA